ncbi:MAG: hypothetical protein ABJD68_17870 [Nakamurella sp.]
MAVDLAVETDLLRQAADLLDDASAIFDGRTSPALPGCPLTDSSLGNSAVAREVVGAARRRVSQAIEAAVLLAAAATDGAGRLRGTAMAFDNTEATVPAQPR